MNSSFRYHLLTGATGLIGSQLLARLLRRHVPVCVLVRPRNGLSERARIDSVLKRFESSWGQRLARPTILAGDLTLPGLGMSDADGQIVAEHCSSVIHLAASLSFRPASRSEYNEPYRTNVEGTRELLALCARIGIKEFHYVSTAYVCGSETQTFYEDDLDVGQSFSNDYEHSKVLAEQLLRSSDALTSLTIYRPSIVIDTTGNSPSSEDRTLYVALSMYRTMAKKFGVMSDGNWFEFLGCSGNERKNMVEARWVADVIDGIVDNNALHGRTYNLTAAIGTEIREIEAAFKQVIQSTNASRPSVTEPTKNISSHLPNVGSRLLAFSKNAISRGTRTIVETIAAPYLETFAPYFRNDPVFDRRNLSTALSTLGMADLSAIAADTIVQFARIQESELSSAKQGTDRGTISSKDSAVNSGDWLEACRLESNYKSADAGTAARSDGSWGVLLIGPGGGDWRIDLEPFKVTAAGQCCNRRIYTDNETWERLLSRTITVDDAVDQCRLSVEMDVVKSEGHDLEVIEQLTQFLTSLQRRFSAPRVGTAQ